MVYVTSDIHGEYSRYLMLISVLQDNDVLYIVGDCIDRQPGGIDILLDIMNRPNVHLILGNHEYMMMTAHKKGASYWDRANWYDNGGSKTEAAFRKLDNAKQQQIMDFLRSCPNQVEVSVDNRCFHLVHGWPGDCAYDRVWGRPSGKNPLPGKTVIVGHTVTAWIAENVQAALSHGHICIYPKKDVREKMGLGYIAIDCGCGHPLPRKLACLRLDDMEEFYF